MIVVTGSTRTGTSWTMQTLKGIGVPVAGLKFHPEFSHKELNPGGYYDLPIAETINGIQDERYKGMGVKLFGFQLSRTMPSVVNRVIVCHRDIDAASKSTMRLLDAEKDWTGIEPDEELCRKSYRMNYGFIWDWLLASSIPFLVLRCGEEGNIEKIREFVGGR